MPPIFRYIFPENVPGSPIVSNNFNTIPFLTARRRTPPAASLSGKLNPWPDSTIPQAGCQAPIADTGGPYTGPAGGTVRSLARPPERRRSPSSGR